MRDNLKWNQSLFRGVAIVEYPLGRVKKITQGSRGKIRKLYALRLLEYNKW